MNSQSTFNRFQQGVTFIEMSIAMAIIGVFLAMGMPMMSDWIQNRQVNVMAESVVSGLRLAQSEAVQRNSAVAFVLTSSSVNPAPTNPSTVTLTDGGLDQSNTAANWMVRIQGVASADGFLQGKSAADGASRARISGWPGTVFTSLGRVRGVLDLTGTEMPVGSQVVFRILNPFVADTSGRKRCVFVTSGGAVKMCDPKVTIPGDGRSCQPQLTTTQCPG